MKVSMPHAAFYVVQLHKGEILVADYKFQCRTQHFMWCNFKDGSSVESYQVSMPHAAFYVVQHRREQKRIVVVHVSMPHAAFYVVQL